MGDSTYEYPSPGKKKITFKHLNFPVSKAVMASSCVPFAFTPVKISKQFFTNPDDMQRVKPMLIDGGVYDNQGAHRLCHAGSVYECNTVIVSDAGTGFKPLTKMNNTLMLLMQTSELFMNRIKNFQFISNLILNKYYGKKIIAYLSLSNKPEECIAFFVDLLKGGKIMDEVIESHQLTSENVAKMSKNELINHLKERINYSGISKNIPSKELHQKALNIGTNLTALNADKINALVVVAKVLTELQVKLYCPGLLKENV